MWYTILSETGDGLDFWFRAYSSLDEATNDNLDDLLEVYTVTVVER